MICSMAIHSFDNFELSHNSIDRADETIRSTAPMRRCFVCGIDSAPVIDMSAFRCGLAALIGWLDLEMLYVVGLAACHVPARRATAHRCGGNIEIRASHIG